MTAKPLPEEAKLEKPRFRDVHTEEECDRMLRLPLAPEVRDAWLDERLSCMQALAEHAVKKTLREAK